MTAVALMWLSLVLIFTLWNIVDNLKRIACAVEENTRINYERLKKGN